MTKPNYEQIKKEALKLEEFLQSLEELEEKLKNHSLIEEIKTKGYIKTAEG